MSKKRQRVPGVADEAPEWSQLPNNKEAHSSQGSSAQEGVSCPSEAPQLDIQWMRRIHKTCTKIAICCLVMNDSIFHNEGWVQEDYSQVISKIIYAISSRLVLGAICFKEKQASGSGGKGIRYDNIIQMGVEGGDTSQFLVEWKHGKESTFNEYRTNDMPKRLMELAKNNFGSKNNAEGFLCIASRKYPEVDQSVNLGANQKEIIIVEYESFLDISNSFDFREAVKTSIKTGNCHEDMKRHLLEFYNLLEGLHERDTIMTDVFDIILIQYNMHERERVLWFFNEKNILYDFIHGQDKIVVESHCRRRWYDLASQHDRKHSQAFVSQVVDVQDFDESRLRTGFIQIEIVRYVDGLEQYCLSTWKGRQNEDCPAHQWVIGAMEFRRRMALEEQIGQAINVTRGKMYRFAMERYRKSIRGLVWMEDCQRAYVTYSNDPDQGEIEVDTVSIDTVGEEVAKRMIGTYPEIWRPARREDRITALDKEDFRTGKTCKMCNKEIYSVEDVTEKEGIQYHGSCYYKALISRSSRGECAVCKLQVLLIHERTKNEVGQYYHLNCWTMFSRIKALEKDVATMREELKSKEMEEKTYDHVHTQDEEDILVPETP